MDKKKIVADAVKKPCPECPFNRHVKPGTLGGSPIETYVGQIYGPFALACHMHCDFSTGEWSQAETYTQTPQCAGAAILRANIGVDEIMPPSMPRAERNTDLVFSDIAEFAQHHLGGKWTTDMLRIVLNERVILALVEDQMRKAKWKLKP